MTIRHLRIFIEVAETGKMSTAAAKLFVSQPTVSQAIRELEEHYGLLLFDRLNRKLYITIAGKKLLKYAKNVVTQFDALEDNMFNLSKVEKIRIGATMTVGECILSNIVNRLKKDSPQVEIYSYSNNTQIIEEKILNNEIDIGIIEGKVKSKDLIVMPEASDYLVLACSTDHPFAKRSNIHVKELEGEKFAMREKGSGTRELFEDYMSENEVDIKIVFEANSSEAIKKEVIENNCLAVISICLMEQEIKESKLHAIKSLAGSWNRNFSIVYHKDKLLTDGMKSLIAITKDYKYIPNNIEYNPGILTT